jgi:hypothetical protein
MISSIATNSRTVPQTDYPQRQSLAPTKESNQTDQIPQTAQQDTALKIGDSQTKDNKQIGELSEGDLSVIRELKQRDSEVRAHEAAHLAAAGSIATGGASFNYQQGPDGVQYAIGGEVVINTSPVSGDPAATLQKANTIRRAALAPAQPSGPDMQAAASATLMAAQALTELLQKKLATHNIGKDQRGAQLNLST